MSNPAGWHSHQPDGRQWYWDGEPGAVNLASGVPSEPTIPIPLLEKRHVTASRHVAPSSRRRFGVADAFCWGTLALTALIGAVRSGFSGVAMMLGSFALVVGVIALARGRVGWARLRSRTAGGIVLGASLIFMTVGWAAAPPTKPASVTAVAPVPSPTSVAEPVATATPTLDPVATAPAQEPVSAPHVAAPRLVRPPPAPEPSPAPAPVAPGNGATALCNDGTLSFKAHRQGACASHGGVEVFYK